MSAFVASRCTRHASVEHFYRHRFALPPPTGLFLFAAAAWKVSIIRVGRFVVPAFDTPESNTVTGVCGHIFVAGKAGCQQRSRCPATLPSASGTARLRFANSCPHTKESLQTVCGCTGITTGRHALAGGILYNAAAECNLGRRPCLCRHAIAVHLGRRQQPALWPLSFNRGKEARVAVAEQAIHGGFSTVGALAQSSLQYVSPAEVIITRRMARGMAGRSI